MRAVFVVISALMAVSVIGWAIYNNSARDDNRPNKIPVVTPSEEVITPSKPTSTPQYTPEKIVVQTTATNNPQPQTESSATTTRVPPTQTPTIIPTSSPIPNPTSTPTNVPVISFESDNSTAIEGDNRIEIMVILSEVSEKIVSVDFQTGDLVAQSGSDYYSTRGTLAISPGGMSQSINIVIIDDFQNEPNEEFVIELQNPQNAVLGPPERLEVIIEDNDSPPPPRPTPPSLPSDNRCEINWQSISSPSDLENVSANQFPVSIVGTATYTEFGKFEIWIRPPNGSYIPEPEAFSPVIGGKLYSFDARRFYQAYGPGWYIIRLVVIQPDGNRPPVGPQEGCHIRVYVPEP